MTTATSITIGFMPPGPAGQVNITATYSWRYERDCVWEYLHVQRVFPSVTEVSPSNGATSGGEAISLLGSGYGLVGQDFVTDVYFGTTDVPESSSFPARAVPAGCFVVVGPTVLAVYTPANAAGTVDVEVETPSGTGVPRLRDKYTFVAPGAYSAVTHIGYAIRARPDRESL